MSRITITLPNSLIDELMKVVDASSKTEAVVTAIKDAIRIRKKERIRNLAGKIEFTADAEIIRHEDPRLG